MHQNDPQDAGYRQFLGRLFNPMVELLKPEDQGLDYGSGPGPTLSLMFEEQGYTMAIYDYIYAQHDGVFEHVYDFITCTETIEHFRNPRDELQKIWRIIKTGGYLGIMTGVVNEQTEFANWHYKNDPTHVCFYSYVTINWITNLLQAKQVYVEGNVVIIQKLRDTESENI